MFLLVFVIPAAIAAVFLSRAYADVDEAHVHEWAGAHGLRLTTANRPLVWWYLRNARVLRTWGVMAGIVLPPLALAALGRSEQGVRTFMWCVFAGHLVGAVYAEITLRRPTPRGARTATLDRREVRQYLPGRLRFAPLAVTALALGLLAVGASTGDLAADTQRTAGIIAAVSVTLVAGIGLAQRWVVTRPQPFTEAELIEADDAIRSQSVHMLAGSGTAVLLALFADVLSAVAMECDAPVSTVVGLTGIVFGFAAFVSCLYYGHRAWRVRRTPRRHAVTVS